MLCKNSKLETNNSKLLTNSFTMKKIYATLALAVLLSQAIAQQDIQFTQFMQKKIAVNPAYAGSRGFPVISAIHRQQWVGLDGAPSTQALSIHAPVFADRVGLGLTLINDRIGYFGSLYGNLQYSYRMVLGKGIFSVGMQGSFRRFSVDYSAANTISGDDPNLPTNLAAKTLFNIGFGGYYQTDKFYLGASVPRFLENGLGADNQGVVNDFTGEVPHYYLMLGCIATLTEDLKLRPAALAKYVKNTPINLDLNLSLGFKEKYWVGATYRTGLDLAKTDFGSFDLLFQYQVNQQLMVGLAYDLALSEIRKTNSGTYEIMLEYGFWKEGRGVRNPRFF